MPPTPVRVMVAGLGEAGSTLHLPALAGLRGTTVVGACDLDEARRLQAAKQWRVPVYADFASMAREVSADVAIIATPPAQHAPLCLQALEAGAHIVCEKPFVMTDAEAGLVLAAAADAGRQVAVNHEFREMPIFRAVIERVRSGAIGTLRFAEARQLVALPAWCEEGWRGALSRRSLFEAGIHLVDLLAALFGEIPAAVRATMTDAGIGERARDAIVSADFEFSSSRLAVLLQNRIWHGEGQYLELGADAEHAACRASFGGRAQFSLGLGRSKRPYVNLEYGASGLAWQERGGRRTTLARNPSAPNMRATRRVLAASFDAFTRGTEPPTSGARARALLAVVDAAYQSAERGRRIAVERVPSAAWS